MTAFCWQRANSVEIIYAFHCLVMWWLIYITMMMADALEPLLLTWIFIPAGISNHMPGKGEWIYLFIPKLGNG